MTQLPKDLDENSLIPILRSLITAENDDVAFVFAASMNLYLEAKRRLHGRVILGPSDAKAILSMVDLLTIEPEQKQLEPTRSRELSTDEASQVLSGENIEQLRRR